MKKHFLLIILLISFIAGNCLVAQTNLREVVQTTQTTRVFAVPIGTDLSKLTNYDFTKMMFNDKIESKQKSINRDFYLNIVKTFPQKPRWKNDYEFEIGKIEINQFGTKLFDHNGRLLHEQIDTIDKNNFKLDAKEVYNYGHNPIFDIGIQELAKMYENMGFVVKISNENELSAISDTLELYCDYKKLILETRFFEDRLLAISDWKQFQKIDKFCIPKTYVITSYDIISAGTRLQISEIINFTEYSILDENGKPLVEYNSGNLRSTNAEGINLSEYNEVVKKNSKLIVFPNPAHESINVEIPYYASDYLNLEIIGSAGNIVYSEQNLTSGSNTNINISNLLPGTYVIRTGKDDKWISTKFIKQ
ncbi:MAG: T9SS type A sorting domain-containing protein [Bacteroidales bacterium]|nr:T9SS type A sorting domain-containing protein [Bacteroidales bacterium]